MRRDWSYWLSSNRGPLIAAALFVAMFTLFVSQHPAGFSLNVINTAANKGALLAFVAIAQTIPVLTSGLHLSVGMVFVMANCLASTPVVGTPVQAALGVLVVLASGLLCGALNGLIVVFGRLQPIIATLATGAIYYGVALWLRPAPGGAVNEGLADFMTGSLGGAVPFSIVLLVGAVLFIWIPYRRSVLGRAAYAIGSSEQAAYMSGVPVARAKFLAYVLAGLFAAIAGLLLTGLTYSGEANALLGGSYTLSSRNFLSLDYLLHQLQVASFLGVIATGAMLVILLGHIDLSIPWVVTTGGMMSTAAAGHGGMAGALAIPFAIACGLGIGLVNGIGVAYLRVPSMIFTLAINAIAQGLMVVHTSGFAPH